MKQRRQLQQYCLHHVIWNIHACYSHDVCGSDCIKVISFKSCVFIPPTNECRVVGLGPGDPELCLVVEILIYPYRECLFLILLPHFSSDINGIFMVCHISCNKV